MRRVALLVALTALWIFPRHAPATIQEQRERLPPAAEDCDDPVAGLWKSHQYDPRYRDWTIFMLQIHRVEGSETELHGQIINHSWDAGPEQQEPPQCSSVGGEWVVSMDARGNVDGAGRIFFGALAPWRLDRVICNFGPSGYNLDNFTGMIDPQLSEFQSVNNDGGRAVNDPTVFRRVQCYREAGPTSPEVVTEPPAFYPRERGCSLF